MDILLMAGLGIAAWIDFKTKKIPNYLTGSLLLAGLFYHCHQFGIAGFQESAAGLLLGAGLLYLPFIWGGMGGGDVKLLAAIGAFTGPGPVLKVFLASAVFGGLLSLLSVARHGAWKNMFSGLKQRLFYFSMTGSLPREKEVSFSSCRLHIPYAVSIALGYLWNCFSGGL